MIRRGDRLENPVTGETLIFHETSRETGGESVLIETIVQPDGFVAAAHVEFESLIETMFGLAADGKTNRKGMPNPIRLAVIARSHFDTVRLPFPPAWLQRAALAVGARLGLLMGYRPTVAAAAA